MREAILRRESRSRGAGRSNGRRGGRRRSRAAGQLRIDALDGVLRVGELLIELAHSRQHFLQDCRRCPGLAWTWYPGERPNWPACPARSFAEPMVPFILFTVSMDCSIERFIHRVSFAPWRFAGLLALNELIDALFAVRRFRGLPLRPAPDPAGRPQGAGQHSRCRRKPSVFTHNELSLPHCSTSIRPVCRKSTARTKVLRPDVHSRRHSRHKTNELDAGGAVKSSARFRRGMTWPATAIWPWRSGRGGSAASSLRMVAAEGPFLAVADRLHAIRGDSQRDQEILGRLRPAVAQRQVVFGGTALVAMAFDDHFDLRIGFRRKSRRLHEGGLRVGTNVGLVEIEVGVLHFARE